MLNRSVVSALNHLLVQSGWAQARLARFAGKTVQFDVAPFSFAYTVQDKGLLQAAAPGTEADARCHFPLTLLPRLALQDEQALSEVHTEGNAALLSELFHLSRNLRWDAAEDLSRFTGDVAAERIVQFAQAKHRHLLGTLRNLSQASAEYLTEERPVLAKPGHISLFIHQVDTLRDDAARLEQRISRLERRS